MFIIKYRSVFFLISLAAVAASIWSLAHFGLKLGTEFTGGSALTVEYSAGRPTVALTEKALAPLKLKSLLIQPAGERELIVRSAQLSDAEHAQVLTALQKLGTLTERQFSTVGPTLGQELARKGLVAIVLAVLVIIIFIAIAFRHASRPVRSWKYGVTAIIALLHDVTIPAGIFSLLGHYRGVEVDGLFLTALLTGFALSVNDTIVVFDRIRENLKRLAGQPFPEIVGRSLRETFVRSINTSLTVILALLALFLFGSSSTHYFALALLISMFVGTYSSIFIASPLLVVWFKRQKV